MSDVHCDECEKQPYLSPITPDYEQYYDMHTEPDVEVWCECHESIPITFDDSDSFKTGRPEFWGQSGGRFVCYRCGEIPTMISGNTAKTYKLTCMCFSTTGIGFVLRDVMPDKWKIDADETKWNVTRDEIRSMVEEHEPIRAGLIAEKLGVEYDSVANISEKMLDGTELYSNHHDELMTEPTTSGDGSDEDNEYNYTDPEESGLRSGKGSGFFSRLFGL